MKKLTAAQSAYLAGFFDSKGSISITKTQGSANRTPSYVLRVIFSQSGNAGLITLTTYMRMTGVGSLNHYVSSQYGTIQHEWRLISKDAGDILRAMFPYLVVKHEKAIVAIEFADLIETSKHGGRGYVVPENIVKQKEILFQRLVKLKAEGQVLEPVPALAPDSKPLNY